MATRYVLAIDLGTTNCKCLLVDENGAIVQKVSREYPLLIPQPGWAEQHPQSWWEAVGSSLRRITSQIEAGAVKAIGLSGQMHGLVLLNSQGEVIRPAILWNDQRSAPQCEAVYNLLGGMHGLLEYTNNAMLPGYTAGKILWVKEMEPELFRKTAGILLPKDYIRYRLCGDMATDFSDASGTGLFNVKERRWSSELLDRLNIPLEWFPACHLSSEFTGTITKKVAAETGLMARTPVTAGGGDAVMQMVGSGAVDSHTVLIVIGTGGNVSVSIPYFRKNPRGKLQFFCHVLPEKWVAMGVTLTSGSSLKWFRDTLGGLETEMAKDLQIDSYDLLSREASTSPPGSNGLLFVPYLQGERCPHTDVRARGSILGLGLYTKKADIIRSILEGVTYSLRDVLELINQLGITTKYIMTSGGGATSPVWRQIQADVFNKEVKSLNYSEDASALGAAIIAGVKVGLWPSVEEAISLVELNTVNRPVEENSRIYNRLFALYKKQYSVLKPTYDELSASS